MIDSEWRVRLASDPSFPFGDTVTLHIYRRVNGRIEYVRCPDLVWQSDVEGVTATDAGIRVARDMVEPIREGIEQWQGQAGNPKTEVRVLREWLAQESARVDKALDR